MESDEQAGRRGIHLTLQRCLLPSGSRHSEMKHKEVKVKASSLLLTMNFSSVGCQVNCSGSLRLPTLDCLHGCVASDFSQFSFWRGMTASLWVSERCPMDTSVGESSISLLILTGTHAFCTGMATPGMCKTTHTLGCLVTSTKSAEMGLGGVSC